MARKASKAGKALRLPLLLAGVGIAFAIPSAGLAALALANGETTARADFGIFTPASVDPQLARRVAAKIGDPKLRFTPAGTATRRDRTVTVAVRVDSDVAQAISVRQSIESAPGAAKGIAAITPARYNLGLARGYQSFARPVALPDTVRKIDMPDLSKFEPAGPTAPDKPSRFQPRIALEEKGQTGRTAGTLEGLGTSTVDLGGSYRVVGNLNVTAGVRLSQERDRLAPLTDAKADNQAVYVGTQIRF
ncbi:hypothetical protein P7228_05385 [Altererythrobacter arenosus]|uniref:Porin n=1 Tax=Altererythrobacter arenosus TaxID=3032592 RepID=A0ABY8G1M1_9SPHN|nr:hypothetical protein [Altererythrobacter sp. CAU 1644]WFL78499.1 hypothetical protein P7228_05385 [Altererythrobacter sp. CAU 1644]